MKNGSHSERDVLAVIPARGGSKGIPNKNLELVGDRSLVGWACMAAKESKSVDLTVVSTDSHAIAEEAQHWDVAVLMRPPELATDASPVVDTVKHVLIETERETGSHYSLVVLLQPTSPFRDGWDVDIAVQMLRDNLNADSVASVVPCGDVHPGRMYGIGTSGRPKPLMPRLESVQRQELPQVFLRNGCVYVSRRWLVLEQGRLMGPNLMAYVMTRDFLCNIDEPNDLLLARALAPLWEERRARVYPQ